MRQRRAAWLGLLLAVAACAPLANPAGKTAPPAAARPAPLCEAGGVRLFADFAGAGAQSCTATSAGYLKVLIAPEILPINPSPWYAFRIEGPAGTTAKVDLRYASAKHRYAPWTKGPQGDWRLLDPERVTIAPDGSATLDLPPLAGATLVAAQPLDDPEAALEPWQSLARKGKLKRLDAGPTSDGRALPMFLHNPPGARGLLVLTARQHPPEVPGAMAFDAFAARIFASSPEAASMRGAVAILLVPVMNPDGIARGHWRGNAGGADLNRDWGPFAQAEVRAVGRQIEQLAQTLPLIAALDFHATGRDVIYAPPLDAARQDVGEGFMARFKATPEGQVVAVSRSHTPASGTFKGWALDRFGISGLTYEVADTADRAAAKARAEVAADSLIAALSAWQETAPATTSEKVMP